MGFRLLGRHLVLGGAASGLLEAYLGHPSKTYLRVPRNISQPRAKL